MNLNQYYSFSEINISLRGEFIDNIRYYYTILIKKNVYF